jgi:hypothetical protein
VERPLVEARTGAFRWGNGRRNAEYHEKFLHYKGRGWAKIGRPRVCMTMRFGDGRAILSPKVAGLKPAGLRTGPGDRLNRCSRVTLFGRSARRMRSGRTIESPGLLVFTWCGCVANVKSNAETFQLVKDVAEEDRVLGQAAVISDNDVIAGFQNGE